MTEKGNNIRRLLASIERYSPNAVFEFAALESERDAWEASSHTAHDKMDELAAENEKLKSTCEHLLDIQGRDEAFGAISQENAQLRAQQDEAKEKINDTLRCFKGFCAASQGISVDLPTVIMAGELKEKMGKLETWLSEHPKDGKGGL
jgi:hypothetical protein